MAPIGSCMVAAASKAQLLAVGPLDSAELLFEECWEHFMAFVPTFSPFHVFSLPLEPSCNVFKPFLYIFSVQYGCNGGGSMWLTAFVFALNITHL